MASVVCWISDLSVLCVGSIEVGWSFETRLKLGLTIPCRKQIMQKVQITKLSHKMRKLRYLRYQSRSYDFIQSTVQFYEFNIAFIPLLINSFPRILVHRYQTAINFDLFQFWYPFSFPFCPAKKSRKKIKLLTEMAFSENVQFSFIFRFQGKFMNSISLLLFFCSLSDDDGNLFHFNSLLIGRLRCICTTFWRIFK